jgi:hypothetical protein
MLTKFLAAFTILAVLAFAGSIPAKIASGNVLLTVPATVHGTTLKPGSYRVTVVAGKAIFTLGTESKEVPAKVETVANKFDTSRVQYDNSGTQATVTEIGIGGTKIKLIFNN